MDINEKLESNEKMVYRVIHDLEFIPDKADREDIEQEGRVALWQSLLEWEELEDKDELPNCTFGHFIYKNIYNHVVDYLRKFVAKKRQEVIYENGYDEDFEEEVIDSMLTGEIKKILENYDNLYNILIDKYMNGMTYTEMCVKYDMSIKSSRYAVAKAKRILQRKLNWEVE